MRFADRICGLMDGMMGSEVKERMREQICWGGVWGCGEQPFSGQVESQAWLQHTAVPVFTPSTMLWISASFRDGQRACSPSAPPSPHWRFGSAFPSSPLFICSFLSPPPLLLLALTHFIVFLPPLFFSPFFFFFFLQSSGGTAGSRPEPPGFHSDTLCANVISIDDVQLGQAVLAQGVFTVYHKVRPFTKRRGRHSAVCLPVLHLDRRNNAWKGGNEV